MSNDNRKPPKPPRVRKDGQPDRRNPPEAHRFKKGQSGNQSGRRAGVKSAKAVAEAIANQTIKVKRGGKEMVITKQEAMLESVFNEAIRKGDHRSMKALNEVMSSGSNGDPPPSPEVLAKQQALSKRLVDLLTLFGSLKKMRVLGDGDNGLVVAPWVVEAAEARRRAGGDEANPIKSV